ncbi:MAG: 3-hydroxylacyl-ACP dehydratase [Holophagaceae bacterium]|nr:3-hydroxylacyl-ACP dehydratase [Holophagaceae bacterium]
MSAPQVTDLILHRGPALLLERILEVSPTRCIASVRLEPGAWCLQADGTAPAWVGLEWMAQAAAAFSGHRHREAGREPRLGFLLGTRSYEALVPAFPVGLELEVEAEALFLDDSGPGAFTCEVRHKGETLARARLKAIETP